MKTLSLCVWPSVWLAHSSIQALASSLLMSVAVMPVIALGQDLFEPYRLSAQQVPFGDVITNSVQISADGRQVIYLADQDTDGVQELFSVPITGGTPVRLNGALPIGGDVTDGSLQISPDGQHVVYIADQITDGIFELFSVPIQGGQSVRLNAPLSSGKNVFGQGARITPDSNRVVYLADQNTDGTLELFSVSITGGPSIRLNGPLPTGADVASDGVKISADSSRVVYLADQNTNDLIELFSVPIAGGPSVQLNVLLPTGGLVFPQSIRISPDSRLVTYVADQQDQFSFNIRELFSVPVTGGASVRLNAPISAPNDVRSGDIFISEDSSRVVFVTATPSGDGFILQSVPITGGTPVRITPISSFLSSVDNIMISPDDARVVFRSNLFSFEQLDFELYSVPITGGDIVRLNSTLATGGDVSFGSIRVSANSRHVIYVADQNTDDDRELFSVPIVGGTPIRLNSTLPNDGDVVSNSLQISSDSRRVFYLSDQIAGDVLELFSVPITGGASVRLNNPLPFSADIDKAILSADGSHVVYVGDQNVFDEHELFAVRITNNSTDDDLCIPIKTDAGALAVICL